MKKKWIAFLNKTSLMASFIFFIINHILYIVNICKRLNEVNIIDNFIEIHHDYIKIKEATKQGYAIAIEGDSISLEHPNSKTRRGRVGKQIANTLTCSYSNQGVVVRVCENNKTNNTY